MTTAKTTTLTRRWTKASFGALFAVTLVATLAPGLSNTHKAAGPERGGGIGDAARFENQTVPGTAHGEPLGWSWGAHQERPPK